MNKNHTSGEFVGFLSWLFGREQSRVKKSEVESVLQSYDEIVPQLPLDLVACFEILREPIERKLILMRQSYSDDVRGEVRIIENSVIGFLGQCALRGSIDCFQGQTEAADNTYYRAFDIARAIRHVLPSIPDQNLAVSYLAATCRVLEYYVPEFNNMDFSTRTRKELAEAFADGNTLRRKMPYMPPSSVTQVYEKLMQDLRVNPRLVPKA